MIDGVTNVVIAGLGGQGVLTCSDILAATAFAAGLDVKKAEVHGMSQRGGSVTSDVRFGTRILSPMVPAAEADYLLVLEETQVEPTRHRLREDGTLLTAGSIDMSQLPTAKALNVAMLGMLSVFLDLPDSVWSETLAQAFPARLHEPNMKAFTIGRSAGEKEKSHV